MKTSLAALLVLVAVTVAKAEFNDDVVMEKRFLFGNKTIGDIVDNLVGKIVDKLVTENECEKVCEEGIVKVVKLPDFMKTIVCKSACEKFRSSL